MMTDLPQIPMIWFYLLYIWSLFWKGLALWQAAKKKQRNWFIVLLVIPTAGILEITFLLFFAKQKIKFSKLFS